MDYNFTEVYAGNILASPALNNCNTSLFVPFQKELISSFSNVNDLNGLVSDGTFLYGSYSSGGQFNAGFVFKYNISTQSISLVFSFCPDSLDGANPNGLMLSDDSNFIYGTCKTGGLNNQGTFYQIRASVNGFKKILDFSSTTGHTPSGPLVEYNLTDGSSMLAGTNSFGGTFSNGTIFTYNISNQTFSKVFDFPAVTTPFPGETSLRNPIKGLSYIANDGFYGSASLGGPSTNSNIGGVFRFLLNASGNINPSTYAINRFSIRGLVLDKPYFIPGTKKFIVPSSNGYAFYNYDDTLDNGYWNYPNRRGGAVVFDGLDFYSNSADIDLDTRITDLNLDPVVYSSSSLGSIITGTFNNDTNTSVEENLYVAHSFNALQGISPGPLTRINNNLYGICLNGGVNRVGGIYRISLVSKPNISSANAFSYIVNDTVVVTGTNLDCIVSVRVGQTRVSFRQINSTSFSFRAPATAQTNFITVYTTHGSFTSTFSITIQNSLPVFTSLSPTTFTSSQIITVEGSNFLPTTQIIYDNVAVATTYISPSQLSFNATFSPGNHNVSGLTLVGVDVSLERANAYIAAVEAVNSPLSALNKLAIRSLFNALHNTSSDSTNIWGKCRQIFPFAGSTAAAHIIDAKLPLVNPATFNGTYAHSLRSITGNGINTYLNTGVSFSSFTSNNIFAGVFVSTNGNLANQFHTRYGAFNGITIFENYWKPSVPVGPLTLIYYGSPSSALNDGNSQQNSYYREGLISLRENSQGYFFANNFNLSSNLNLSFNPNTINLNLYFGARNNNNTAINFSEEEFRFAFWGINLTPAEALILRNAIDNYSLTPI
jgi:hypothetical protein